MMSHQTVIVLDFDDQYSQLIARRVHKCGVYCEVKPYTTPPEELRVMEPIGSIFADGPNPAYETGTPKAGPTIFELGVPVLGIYCDCQFMTHALGGQITEAREDTAQECGKTETYYDTACKLFKGLSEWDISWMSHGDYMARVSEGFALTAHSDTYPNVATVDEKRGFYGVQYHPEVSRTEHGVDMIHSFPHEICGTKGDWTTGDYKESSIKAIREKVGGDKALPALSGDMDSSMAAALLAEAVDNRPAYVFVNHSLVRENEGDEMEAAFSKWDIHFVRVDTKTRFLKKLPGVSRPERKHKTIGGELIRVFEEEAKKIGWVDYLVQGVIYSDVIGSGAGDAAVIKGHHNMDGLPGYMDFKGIIESLHLLSEDEVRQLGRELDLPEYLVMRQPFPGSDLAIRVTGDLTKEELDTLRDVDTIYREEIAVVGGGKSISRCFTVLTNTRSVGVMGDGHTYNYTLALRAVAASDFMTVDWIRIPYDVLDRISIHIVNEVKDINHIAYDVTSKPPATVEWE